MNPILFRFLFIVLICFSCHAQQVSILYDTTGKLQQDEIVERDFQQISSGYTNGLHQGVYWLKVNPSGESTQVFELRNNRITQVQAYYDGRTIPVDFKNRFLTWVLQPESPTYFKILIEKEAYFTYQISEQRYFQNKTIREAIFLGLFYGFALMVFLLNLNLYLNFKDPTIIYYCCFLFFIIAVFAYRDGFVEILGFSKWFKEISEPSVHAIGGIAGAVFASSFIGLNRHYPILVRSYYFSILPFLICIIGYHVTDNYLFFLGVDLLCLFIFGSSWLAALLLSKAHRHAVIFRISYFFILGAATMFYLFPALGIDWFEIEQKHLKWSGYVEMIVITYAVIYRIKILKKRQVRMRQEMQDYLSEINYLSEELERVQSGEKSIFVEYDLTAREAEILERIAKGDSNKKIAEELFISINTVKFHVKKIYEKLDVSNRKQAFQKVKAIS